MISIPRHWKLALLLALLMQALPSTVPVVGSIQPALADGDGSSDGGGGDSGGSGDGGSDDGGSDDGGSDDGGSDDDGRDADGSNSGTEGAPSGDDHEYAWRERRAGHIRSLKEVLENLRKQGITVLDVKLRHRHDRPSYEIRLLDRRNRLRVKSLPAHRRSRKTYNFNRD